MKTKFLSILSVSVLLLTSCNNGEDMPIQDTNVRVQFSSGVANQALSRAGGTTEDAWDGNEHIGIYMVQNGKDIVAEEAENMEYKAANAGTSTSFNPVKTSDVIYYSTDETQKVDFVAYYPYTAVENYVFGIKTADQSSPSKIDFMRAIANNAGSGYNKTNKSPINLVFDHKMTKIVLNIKKGEGMTDTDFSNLDITLKGWDTEAEYNISKDKITLAGVVADINAYTETKGEKYEVTILPQLIEAGTATIEFALNNAPKNEVLVYKFPKREFVSGKRHIYNVTLKRNEVIVTGTITPWDSLDEEEIIVD